MFKCGETNFAYARVPNTLNAVSLASKHACDNVSHGFPDSASAAVVSLRLVERATA